MFLAVRTAYKGLQLLTQSRQDVYFKMFQIFNVSTYTDPYGYIESVNSKNEREAKKKTRILK